MSSVSLPAELMRRYRRLLGFYDRDGDGRHTLEGDFQPVAVRIARRWQGRPSRFPDLLGLLLDTYRHEAAAGLSDAGGAVLVRSLAGGPRPPSVRRGGPGDGLRPHAVSSSW